jgi:hypothetical protein
MEIFPLWINSWCFIYGECRGRMAKGRKILVGVTRCTIDSSSSVYQQIYSYSKKMKPRDSKLWTLLLISVEIIGIELWLKFFSVFSFLTFISIGKRKCRAIIFFKAILDRGARKGHFIQGFKYFYLLYSMHQYSFCKTLTGCR